jgi:hypothetical protein
LVDKQFDGSYNSAFVSPAAVNFKQGFKVFTMMADSAGLMPGVKLMILRLG